MRPNPAMLPLLLPLLFHSAVDAQASDDWSNYLAFRTEMDRLNREGKVNNPLIMLDLTCPVESEEETCEPVVRLFVHSPSAEHYRLPMLPPYLDCDHAKLVPDKTRLKSDKEDQALSQAACERSSVPALCELPWVLTKVWRVERLAAGVGRPLFTLKTPLVKPGGSSASQLGARTGNQTFRFGVDLGAIAKGVAIPFWELSGVLNMPQTFAPEG